MAVHPRKFGAAITATLFLLASSAFGGSATWKASPQDGDWSRETNWSPEAVPNGSSDIATFGVSNLPEISVAQDIALFEMVFSPGASAYHFTIQPNRHFTFNGAGVQNNSGVDQTIDVLAANTAEDYTSLTFTSGSVAGSDLVIVTHGADVGEGANPGFTQFINTNAGTATLINNGGLASGARGGEVDFFPPGGHAANATIMNEPGVVAGALGGRSYFFSGSADNAVIISEGATVDGALGGLTQFIIGAGAGTSTLIAHGGSNGGAGGVIQFENSAFAPKAQVEVFGNGSLNISLVDSSSFRLGSLAGDGLVFLGANELDVGGTNLDTTFSGVIQDGGSLVKSGSGMFTITGANLYTGSTTVGEGTLVVSNANGSGTGTGAVSVTAGTLGGSGIIAGAVTIGTGSGSGAFLAPAHGTKTPTTLTIEGRLTFRSDSIYIYTFKAKRNRSKIDKVVANGVTINSGATIVLSGQSQGPLTEGMVLTLVKNTAATQIAGTFSNLPDGGIVNVNGNNFQANYSGGDGNDLILTVVQ